MECNDIITLTTDFGLQDPYVGQVKGAILKNNINARVIDITHAITAHDILGAAVTVRTSYRYFPKGTIHLIVVDPDVGSQRHILVAAVDDHCFIAPDNGILTLLLRDKSFQAVHRVENPALFPDNISATFHGRDIMAPVAAALSKGMHLNEVGPALTVDQCDQLDISEPAVEKDSIRGRVLHIDKFGNIRTTITTSHLSHFQPDSFKYIEIGGQKINTITTTYTDAPLGELTGLIDSAGYLEIAVNRGNAEQLTDTDLGDPVIVWMG